MESVKYDSLSLHFQTPSEARSPYIIYSDMYHNKAPQAAKHFGRASKVSVIATKLYNVKGFLYCKQKYNLAFEA